MQHGDSTEARLLLIADVKEGQSSEATFEFTREAVEQFVRLSGDRAPLHVDEEHATAMGFDSLVVHGFFVAVPYSRLLGMFLPGGNSVIHSFDLKLRAPVGIGDRIRYVVTVKRVISTVSSVLLELTAFNQDDQLVNEGTAVCAFRT